MASTSELGRRRAPGKVGRPPGSWRGSADLPAARRRGAGSHTGEAARPVALRRPAPGVLRRERNVDREFRLLDDYEGNPISTDVIAHLFDAVRSALTADWRVGLDTGIERGWLIA